MDCIVLVNTSNIYAIYSLSLLSNLRLLLTLNFFALADEMSKTLPASSNPDNPGAADGGASALVVSIVVALAILIIVAVVFGFVLFRR